MALFTPNQSLRAPLAREPSGTPQARMRLRKGQASSLNFRRMDLSLRLGFQAETAMPTSAILELVSLIFTACDVLIDNLFGFGQTINTAREPSLFVTRI
jgi:hypothetical protein